MNDIFVKDSRPIMVTIQCMVYNHEPFLRQCLDGFVMQRTNFRFEAIIHDDVSTDGSVSIIYEYADKYPDIIKPIIETENQYSKGNCSIERILLENTHGKYVALCEGDDYWTDPEKLQKQFDVFENDPSVSLCYTRSRIYNQSTQTFSQSINCNNGPTDFEGMMFREPAVTLTSFYRRDMYERYLEEVTPFTRGWMMGDTPLWLWLAQNGKIVLLNDITAVYRMLESSASHSGNIDYLLRFNESTRDIRIFFCKKYGRLDLVSRVHDAYLRCNMRDASATRYFKIYFNNFLKLKRIGKGDVKSFVLFLCSCIKNKLL